jgi:hypothetical protein
MKEAREKIAKKSCLVEAIVNREVAEQSDIATGRGGAEI